MKLVELGLARRRRSGGLASDEDHSVNWFANPPRQHTANMY